MGSPSNNQVIFAAGYEPQLSQRSGTGCPAVNRSLAVTIFTLIGFTESRNHFVYKIYDLASKYATTKMCLEFLLLTLNLYRYILDNGFYQFGALSSTLDFGAIIIPANGAN